MPTPPAGDPRTILGANLRAAREAAGLTQEALALRADFSLASKLVQVQRAEPRFAGWC